VRVHADLSRYAAKCDAVECCKWLLKQPEVDPNLGRLHTSPLCAAATSGAERAVAALLADSRVSPNKPRQDGVTPLLMAVQQRHVGIVRLLLADRRVDCNARALYPLRITPLLLAIRGCDAEIVHMLLSEGRSVVLSQNSFQRNTPLEIAAELHCPVSILRMLEDFEASGAVHASLDSYLALDQASQLPTEALPPHDEGEMPQEDVPASSQGHPSPVSDARGPLSDTKAPATPPSAQTAPLSPGREQPPLEASPSTPVSAVRAMTASLPGRPSPNESFLAPEEPRSADRRSPSSPAHASPNHVSPSRPLSEKLLMAPASGEASHTTILVEMLGRLQQENAALRKDNAELASKVLALSQRLEAISALAVHPFK
jgi:hypothetical protein